PTGYCVDENNSQNVGPAGPAFSVAQLNDIGIQRPSHQTVYDSAVTWRTTKFTNATVRTVKRFTRTGRGSDWGPGAGALLVWGRPWFTGELGREAQLYLAVLSLPLRGPSGRVRFRPLYYAGVDTKSGRPRWTHSEAQAKPLALDGV